MAKKQTAVVENRHYDIVLAPHITEKSTMLSEQNAVVFKVAPEYELFAENDLGESIYASPVICGGQLFIRTAQRLYCFGGLAVPETPAGAKS